MKRITLLFILFFCFISDTISSKKNLPLPRFASIKFNEVNVRKGPVRDCPIEWVFVKKGEPVEIIAEYEQWLKIRDINGEGGWAHATVISGDRYVVVTAKNIIPILASPEKYENIVAKVSSGLRCKLRKSEKNWCKIICQSYEGWIQRKYLWGIYQDEKI